MISRVRSWVRISVIVLGLAAAWVAYEAWTFPDVRLLARDNPKTTAWMEMRDAEFRKAGRRSKRMQVWVPIRRISPNLKNAVLIAEDAAFFQHEGIDFDELQEALRKDLEEMEMVRGASTITQQLAKNLYLSPSKSPLRKLRELALTLALERELSKQRIFEIYLNVIEWGENVWGAEAASRFYYGKSCADLTEEEAAALAAVIINPRRYNPLQPSPRIRNRIAMLLERMQRYRVYR